jgi:hypothetical protein
LFGAAGERRARIDRKDPLAVRETTAVTTRMGTTYADIEEGTRLDIVVEFTTRRRIDCETGTAYRLLFTDETGAQVPVVTTAAGDALVDLETGGRYRFADLLGAAPADALERLDRACPDCGSELRRGGVLDAVHPAVAAAVGELDVDGPVGVVDDRTTVARAGDADGPRDGTRPARLDPSATVCPTCDRRGDHPDAVGDGGSRFRRTPAAGVSLDGETLLARGFRERIHAGHTPPPETVDDATLFSDYRFGTHAWAGPHVPVAPRYATAALEHPVTGATERFVAVGLAVAPPADGATDVTLDLETDGYTVRAIHGAVGADAASGRLLRADAVYPWPRGDCEARGGVVLVRVERRAPDATLALRTAWTDPDGTARDCHVPVTLSGRAGTASHPGARTAVALARYARTLRRWADAVHRGAVTGTTVDDWLLPGEDVDDPDRVPLYVPRPFAVEFGRLREALAAVETAGSDPGVARERRLCETLHWEPPGGDESEEAER